MPHQEDEEMEEMSEGTGDQEQPSAGGAAEIGKNEGKPLGHH